MLDQGGAELVVERHRLAPLLLQGFALLATLLGEGFLVDGSPPTARRAAAGGALQIGLSFGRFALPRPGLREGAGDLVGDELVGDVLADEQGSVAVLGLVGSAELLGGVDLGAAKRHRHRPRILDVEQFA